MFMFLILVVGGIITAMVFFILSFHKTLSLIPPEHHLFPNWFSWFLVIPVIGLIFMWMMLPFGLPKAIKKYRKEDQEMQKQSKNLFALGIAYVALGTLGYLFGFLAYIALTFPALIVLVIYWVNLEKVKKKLSSIAVKQIVKS